MRDTALFVGWGRTFPGRERFAIEHFAEWEEILYRLKAEHGIEDFETVLLGPHGGDLDGFTIVYGTPEKLAAIDLRPEVVALRTRAKLDHANLSVIPATTGDEVERQLSLVKDAIAEYEREPVLV